MSRGKYLSLEEARKSGKLNHFANEHPSEGDRKLFDRLFGEMSKTIEEDEETSSERNENFNGTRIRRRT